MQTVLFILLAPLMGIMVAVYLPMNSSMARYLDSPITASIPFFFVGLVTSIVLLFLMGEYRAVFNIKTVPLYLFLPGFLAAFMILGTTFLLPKIGARTFYILWLAGQLSMAMVLSHFGLLESPLDPITFKKMLGVFLMFAGAVLSII